MIRLHNTRTKRIDTFEAIDETNKTVSLYTCGPTVYGYLHVGNWFGYIMWDVLVRTLTANGYAVNRVMNITDVGHLVSDGDEGEDKLQKGARRENKTAWQVAEFYTEDFLAGLKKLHLIEPTHITKATNFIKEQLDLIRVLKQKGYTYQTSDGIYFATDKFPTYADFAGLDVAAQKAGARVEYNDEKKNASDFALWKFSPLHEKRDMEWDTPTDLLDAADDVRKGFPGWHLECSAMAMDILGASIDIHTGGIDHIPVHHTNEIAQSEAASGKRFSQFWLHNNHLKSDGTKISKSLGNGYTLQDLAVRNIAPLDFKLFVLQSHFSNESNFTFENVLAAKSRLHHWRNIACLRWQIQDTLQGDSEKNTDDSTISVLATSQALLETLNNNLDTPSALRIIDQAFSKIDTTPPQRIHRYGLVQLLESIDTLLGLELLPSTPDIDDSLKQLILERVRARETKNWIRSDEIRVELAENGIAVNDTPTGSVWQRIES